MTDSYEERLIQELLEGKAKGYSDSALAVKHKMNVSAVRRLIARGMQRRLEKGNG